jgi:3-hydroxybutyryl-CoA dehydrogenase
MRIRSVGVIGAGMMGQGIVRTAAQAGIDVVFKEVGRINVDMAMRSITQAFDREIERWAITASEKKAYLSRIQGTDTYDDIHDCDLVIEAVEEELEKKQEVFRDLDVILPEDRILITNTSTLSVSEISQATKRPDRVIGMHFMNPVKRLLVEVVRGFDTSDETFAVARDFAEALGKTPIEVTEYPGYVTTRVVLPLLNEAMHVVMEGVATAEDVDKAMRLGFDLAVGPLQMADRIGLDEILMWLEHLMHELGESKYRPSALLRKLVRAGHLGVKTGKGIYNYDAEGNIVPTARGGRP